VEKDRKIVLLQAVLDSEMLLQILPTCEVHGMPSDTLKASPVVMKVVLFGTNFLFHAI